MKLEPLLRGTAYDASILMQQAISGYHKDAENDWVAQLACGHFQHVRHSPPYINRPWVITKAGRLSMIGYKLNCKKCDLGSPKDELLKPIQPHS